VVKTKSILVRLPPAVKRGVDEQSERLGISRNQFIADAVELYLDEGDFYDRRVAEVEKDRKKAKNIWWK
jgi:predicted DNA-binding protein